MKHLGNIVTQSKTQFKDPVFKVCGSVNECEFGLPILIVGLENARKLIPDMTGMEFSILNHTYPYNGNGGVGAVFWAFARNERRDEFHQSLAEFYEYCVRMAYSDIKYIYINPLTMGYTKAKSFIRWVRSESHRKLVWNYANNVLFLYHRDKKVVYGIPWGILDYMGIQKEKVMDIVKGNKSNSIMWNDNAIPKEIRRIVAGTRYYEMPLYLIFSKNSPAGDE